MAYARLRLPLVLAVGLGLTMAALDVAHDHRREERDGADCQSVCFDNRVHVSGHSSHDTSQAHPPCAICAARAPVTINADRARIHAAAIASAVCVTDQPCYPRSGPRRARERAPPWC